MLRRSALLGLAASATNIACGQAQSAPLDLRPYRLSFNAEFGDAKAHYLRRNGGPFTTRLEDWGGLRTLPKNKELQLYVDSSFIPNPAGTDQLGRNDGYRGAPLGYNPFSIEDGCLVITAIPCPAPLRQRVDRPYLSGLIGTDRTFAQKYGYFEIRFQAPGGAGLWPAFWLVSKSGAEEIDVVETIGEPNCVYQSVHLPGHPKFFGKKIHTAFDYSDGMHSYGVVWNDRELIFFIDGIESCRANALLLRSAAPMYLLANLAVGGSWPGNPMPETPFPARLRIKHIRAYTQRN